MKSIIFPKCAKTFKNFFMSDIVFYHMYNSIGSPKPFDVTLRDGLQCLKLYKNNIENFNLEKKITLYDFILENYKPQNIEIGSVVSEKIFPIFKDTEQLFNYAETYKYINNYVLVPNENKLLSALNYGVKNFSFITSVSNSFQIKNTRTNLQESYNSLKNMTSILEEYSKLKMNCENRHIYEPYKHNIKIYVSCINECPIEGIIDTSVIVDILYKLSELKPNKICLSDTCGTLKINVFREIINGIKNRGLNCSLFSLHLHIKPENEGNAEEIIHYALDNNINEFDVSLIKFGGCSVTMEKNKLLPNMTYEQYYSFLTNYIINKCK
jgi:isopropylmalate/homocitrate/citramalate synthase